MSIILCMSFCIVLFKYFLSMLITAILLSPSCPIVDLKNVLMRQRELKGFQQSTRLHGIDMIFYETSTKTYFNPPDYTHMHSRTDINQHGCQLIRSSSPSAVLIITPSPSGELNVLTPSNNSHPVK